MKLLILLLSAVVVANAANPALDQEWQLWKKTNQKVYKPKDEKYRRFVWENNYKLVTEHNRQYALGNTSFTVAMNKFADMTKSEFSKQMNTLLRPKKNTTVKPVDAFVDVIKLPNSVDWRTKGYVTPVKDQGDCGSCWAFSATGSLEGQMFKKTGKLVSLSEQNLIDCTEEKYDCYGCEGGFETGAFEYIQDNNGIDSEATYPYEARMTDCRFNPNNVAGTVQSFTSFGWGSESALQAAVANIGPISVAINADSDTFYLYKSGVYDDPTCSSIVMHAVLVVGYGNLNCKEYWIVKNSWSAKWGDKGYILMSRNKNNQCGIATDCVYPNV